MQTQRFQEIKEVIKAELPGILKSDPDMREFILRVTRESHADKQGTKSRFDRIMDELKRDREARDKKWEAQEKKWETQYKKWEVQDKKEEVQDKKWEAQFKKWEAQDRKDEAQEKKWEAQEERWKAWERKWDEERRIQDKKWAENQRVINEILLSIKKLDQKHDSTIGALGARWGLHSEGAFRKGLRGILEGSFGVTVERYEDYDHEGIVFGRPDQVEMDVIIHNGTLILCEIKSSMSKSDMYAFWRKKEFYEDKHARKANRVMVISPMIDDRAGKAAEQLNIELFGYAEDVKF